MVLLVAVVAWVIARNPQSEVLGLVGYAWAGFGSAFGPIVLFSLLWPRMTRNGALAGMLTGAVLVVVWRQGAWFGLYEMIPGFIGASVVLVLVSLADKAPSVTMVNAFRRMEAEMAEDDDATPLQTAKQPG